MKKKSLWIFLASFLIVAWVAQSTYRTLSSTQERYRQLSDGEILPADTPLVNYEGKTSTISEYAGKVVLINFWAAWCAPCLKEMPSLYALHEQLSEKGFSVIAVSMDDDLEKGRATLERIAGVPPFPMYIGNNQVIFKRFPIEGLPYTVIVDRQGAVRYAKIGERDWMSKESVELIEGML